MSKFAQFMGLLLASTIAIPAQAQTKEADQARLERKLDELRAMREDMQRQMGTLQQQMGEFDNQIDAVEAELNGGKPTPQGQASQPVAANPAPSPAPAVPLPPSLAISGDSGLSTSTQVADAQAADGQAKGGFSGFMERQQRAGRYDPNLGFIVADDDDGMLAVSFTTYVRYLNQNALDDTYTDSFGRVKSIDLRNEVQLNKVSLNFKGWLFDPKFQYLLFAWTNNANQGEGAQVVLAGFLRYKFADWLTLTGGIMPLPTTRSTNWSFPKWLRHDNRVMADEFYRGSYTSGFDISGKITDGLEYRAMIGNNLSTLGVSSRQLDNKFDTYSGALWWMPTTGEFGSSNGFGDYDYHEEVATFLGGYYTHSTETAQGQPSADEFENSQIRLTDGTLLFSPDPFNTGGRNQIEEARYRMASIDAGVKYKGFSLEGQWYWRWVDNFKTIGTVPVDKVSDNGFVVQASAMPIKDLLQVYGTASKMWGANGNPSEYSLGVNVYPFKRREMHVNFQTLRLKNSPVGGYHLPVPVGGDGWVFLTDWVVMF
ncbi:MAG: hypothetical protein ABWZ75_08845 [Novosphingobium sp.]